MGGVGREREGERRQISCDYVGPVTSLTVSGSVRQCQLYHQLWPSLLTAHWLMAQVFTPIIQPGWPLTGWTQTVSMARVFWVIIIIMSYYTQLKFDLSKFCSLISWELCPEAEVEEDFICNRYLPSVYNKIYLLPAALQSLHCSGV